MKKDFLVNKVLLEAKADGTELVEIAEELMELYKLRKGLEEHDEESIKKLEQLIGGSNE